MPPKRKAPSRETSSSAPPAKKAAISGVSSTPDGHLSPSREGHPKDQDMSTYRRTVEEYGIVQREFYPAEMSNERCAQYNNNEIARPMLNLEDVIKESAEARLKIAGGESVVHWFKRDLRIHDNRGLSLAGRKAKELGVPLICLYIVSPQDYQAHLTSAARVDFELRSLQIMKEDLAELDIPLFVTTIDKRKTVPEKMLDLCRQWGAKHMFCNIEYEVDELRREDKMIRLCLEQGIDFTAVHDDVIVPPGSLRTGQGKQYAVYSPWFRSWVSYLHNHPELLNEHLAPERNSSCARAKYASLFSHDIPSAPPNKALTDEERDRFRSLWPAGEHEALDRLQKFLDQRVKHYKDARNLPAANSTGMVSVHFSTGTLAARTAIRHARKANTTKSLDGGIEGIKCWISEVAWRDFYKHVLAHWPYVCMHKPFKYEYTQIKWEYNDEQFKRWCDGQTGFPIIDAAMRQMKQMAYMHNRCRMIVASFLAKDLLIDWRMGERYFMESLIDGDFASNNGGWGFSSSAGVDPQPYFRIFNPLLQSEKFDEGGEYIRKWVPELRNVHGKAIHDPYGRGEGIKAAKAGYPKPMVDHKECRNRALDRYKQGIGRSTT